MTERLEIKNKYNFLNIIFIAIFFIMTSFCLTGCDKPISPELWILEWENAYTECENTVPLLPPEVYSLPPEQLNQKFAGREVLVNNLMKDKYYDLYKLKDKPEYKIKLLELQKEQRENNKRLLMQNIQQIQADTLRMQQNSQQITNEMFQRQENDELKTSIDNQTAAIDRYNSSDSY